MSIVDMDMNTEEGRYYAPPLPPVSNYHEYMEMASVASTIMEYVNTNTNENKEKIYMRGTDTFKAGVDKGFHTLYYPTVGKVEVFSTPNKSGNYIRDAITGVRYNIRVGSPQEAQFFKVKDTVYKAVPQDNIFYYDSPEQYERHTKSILSVECKKNWGVRYNYLQN